MERVLWKEGDKRQVGAAEGRAEKLSEHVLPFLPGLSESLSDETADVEETNLRQPAPLEFSLIIPAYNEERRIQSTIESTVAFFKSRNRSFELLVVNDGSSDGTKNLIERLARDIPELRLIDIPINRGKGNAVREGVRAAEGGIVVFADADGATPIGELEKLERAITQGAHVAIASRAIADAETTVRTSFYRKLLGRAFSRCINALLLPEIADTQCGFKAFRGDAARFLFERSTAERFSFDFEILYLARRAGIKVSEIAVNWTNIPGSKVRPWRDGIRMLWDILVFRWRHRGISPHDAPSWLRGADEPKA